MELIQRSLVILIVLSFCAGQAHTVEGKYHIGNNTALAPAAVFEGTGFGAIPDSPGDGPGNWGSIRDINVNVHDVVGNIRGIVQFGAPTDKPIPTAFIP